jgi:4'-phosphopantetheinyl transferase
MSPVEVQVCIATPEAVPALAWGELEGSLDAQERERSGRFRAEADRRAFVLAHGLRRALLARELGVAPGTLQFSEDANGRPLLIHPAASQLFFSHSRNRHAVALAFTRFAPVGIDVEFIDAAKADFALLDPFVELPFECGADRGPAGFYRCWTRVEAFWKAAGVGLASGNPRIRSQAIREGEHEVTAGAAMRARAISLQAHGLVATVAVIEPQAQAFGRRELKLVHCDSPFGLLPRCMEATAP